MVLLSFSGEGTNEVIAGLGDMPDQSLIVLVIK